MSVESYYVTGIWDVPTRNPQVTQFQIGLEARGAGISDRLITTVRETFAAAFQRAFDQRVPVAVELRESSYGFEPISVTVLADGELRWVLWGQTMLARMIPHGGELGTSGWVLCEAPCCERLHPEAGGYAIPRGVAHYIDTRTRKHVHADCYLELRQLTDGDGPDSGGAPRGNSATSALEEPVAVGPARSVR